MSYRARADHRLATKQTRGVIHTVPSSCRPASLFRTSRPARDEDTMLPGVPHVSGSAGRTASGVPALPARLGAAHRRHRRAKVRSQGLRGGTPWELLLAHRAAVNRSPIDLSLKKPPALYLHVCNWMLPPASGPAAL